MHRPSRDEVERAAAAAALGIVLGAVMVALRRRRSTNGAAGRP
jgi:hypothetical protein